MRRKLGLFALFTVLCATVFATPSIAMATSGNIFGNGVYYSAMTYAGHGTAVDLNGATATNPYANDYRWPLYAPDNGSTTTYNDNYGAKIVVWTSSDGSESLLLAHLDQVGKIGSVQSGDLIGYLGSTGNSTGNHVHVQRKVNGVGTSLVLNDETISPYTYPSARIYLSRGPKQQGVRPPNTVVPGDAGFTRYGTASGWSNVGGGLYGTGIYTFNGGATRDNYGRWTFDLSKLSGTGSYKVEAYIPSTHAGTRRADYHINTAAGVQHHVRDQEILSNQWADLGTYTLNAGAAWVELDDVTGEAALSKEIAFDAIRLTYVGPVTPPVTPPETPPVTPPTKRPTAVTIAGPSSSLSGSAINVTGLLKLTTGAALSTRPVILYSSPDGISWKTVKTVTSASTGALSASVAPTSKTYYRFEFRGDAGFAPCWSASFVITPKARLVRSTSWSTLYRSKTYYAKGYISPRHATGDTNKVRIRAYKKGSDGRYHYVKSFTASYSYYSSTKTLYKAPVKLTSNGYWKLVAYHAADGKNAKTYGSADYVKVR